MCAIFLCGDNWRIAWTYLMEIENWFYSCQRGDWFKVTFKKKDKDFTMMVPLSRWRVILHTKQHYERISYGHCHLLLVNIDFYQPTQTCMRGHPILQLMLKQIEKHLSSSNSPLNPNGMEILNWKCYGDAFGQLVYRWLMSV